MRNILFCSRPTVSFVALAVGLFFFLISCVQGKMGSVELEEEFENPTAFGSEWIEIVSGDFADTKIDIVDSSVGGKLRLGASTLGTESRTVKFLGVRSREAFMLQVPSVISWDFDWNNQSNGSYLSAGLILSPHATGSRPTDDLNWLKVSYVGVPPGKNARLEITGTVNGSQKTYFTEGWPALNRHGRRIGLQSLKLKISETTFELQENGKTLYQSNWPFNLEKYYIYLFITSHSNYGLREVYFDNLEIRKQIKPTLINPESF